MSRMTLFAAGSFVVAAVFLAFANFGDDDGNGGTGPYFVTLGIALAAAVVLFWLARRFLERPSTPALVFAIVGAVSLVVFWLGVTPALAAVAAYLGLESRQRPGEEGGGTGKATAAIAIAALTIVAFAVACIVG
jgi:asparagine N-glycosylation enzyme membrane subunit Stt3